MVLLSSSQLEHGDRGEESTLSTLSHFVDFIFYQSFLLHSVRQVDLPETTDDFIKISFVLDQTSKHYQRHKGPRVLSPYLE